MRVVPALLLLTGCGARSTEVVHDEIASEGDADATERGSDTGSDLGPGADKDPIEPEPDPGRACIARSENLAPSPPVPIYPDRGACIGVVQILKAENATDADGDTLRYHFQLDVDYRFDEFDLQETSMEGIAEGSGWFTWWRPPIPLRQGQDYWWRVWVDDCFARSEPAISFFRVCVE